MTFNCIPEINVVAKNVVYLASHNPEDLIFHNFLTQLPADSCWYIHFLYKIIFYNNKILEKTSEIKSLQNAQKKVLELFSYHFYE